MRTHAYAAPGATGPLWSAWVPMMGSPSSPTGFVIFVAETFMPMVLHIRIVPLWALAGILPLPLPQGLGKTRNNLASGGARWDPYRKPSMVLPMAPHVRRVAPPRWVLWAWEIGRPEVYQWTLEC